MRVAKNICSQRLRISSAKVLGQYMRIELSTLGYLEKLDSDLEQFFNNGSFMNLDQRASDELLTSL